MIERRGAGAELVVTAPSPYGVSLAYLTRARTTLGVLAQLIASSRRELLIGTPFLHRGKGLLGEPLSTAVESAARRGVQLRIISTTGGLNLIDWARKARDDWGAQFYCALPNLKDPEIIGSHAKFCISDRTIGYVGSANFTGPGLTEHLEMGLLVRGSIVVQIAGFWDSCIDLGLIAPPLEETTA